MTGKKPIIEFGESFVLMQIDNGWTIDTDIERIFHGRDFKRY